MTETEASSILSTSKTCNRLDQFLRLVKGDICARNPLIFSSHRVRSSYSGRSTRITGHVGRDDENYRKVPGLTCRNCRSTSLSSRFNFISSAPQILLAPQEKALPRPAYHPRASDPFDHAWTKHECFCLQIRVGNRSTISSPRTECSGSGVRC